MNRFLYSIALPVFSMFLAQSVPAQTVGASDGAQVVGPMTPSEKDRRAPADYGFGPGVKPGLATRAVQSISALFASGVGVPSGGPEAHIKGVFGPPVTWPLMPIHALLTPDGRVLTYGTDDKGLQGAEEIYDIWDPRKGSLTSLCRT